MTRGDGGLEAIPAESASGEDCALERREAPLDQQAIPSGAILVGKQKGQKYEYVIPKSTILIENPVAIVDTVVDKHDSRKAASALLDFLLTPEAQRIYAKHGLRPVNAEVAKEVGGNYPKVEDLFTIRDLGDWAGVQKVIFDTGTGYDNALSKAGSP